MQVAAQSTCGLGSEEADTVDGELEATLGYMVPINLAVLRTEPRDSCIQAKGSLLWLVVRR